VTVLEADVSGVNSYAEWLRARIKARGWSQHYVARRIGISQSAISLVLSGKTLRNEERVVRRLATLFGDVPEWAVALTNSSLE